MANFSELEGKTLVEIRHADRWSDEIVFVTSEGEEFVMSHSQDCCESVSIEEISGNILDLLITPIISAYESTNEDDSAEDGTGMWTFYNISTVIGSVNIRWYGSSNGYYGVGVSFTKRG